MKNIRLPLGVGAVCLAFLLLFHTNTVAEEFSYENMTRARMKLDPAFDFEAYAESYMRCFRPVVYKTYRNDEFQFRDKKLETIQLMKKAAEQFSPDTRMSLLTDLTLGEYDFDNSAFPIVESTGRHFWYTPSPGSEGDLPRRYEIYFDNRELIATMPLPEDKARELIARRRSRSGSVNRSVEATIIFTVTKMKNSSDEFYTTIQSATIYEDKNRTRQLYRIVKPQDKVSEKVESGQEERQRQTPTR
jgi:hypothetical protein